MADILTEYLSQKKKSLLDLLLDDQLDFASKNRFFNAMLQATNREGNPFLHKQDMSIICFKLINAGHAELLMQLIQSQEHENALQIAEYDDNTFKHRIYKYSTKEQWVENCSLLEFIMYTVSKEGIAEGIKKKIIEFFILEGLVGNMNNNPAQLVTKDYRSNTDYQTLPIHENCIPYVEFLKSVHQAIENLRKGVTVGWQAPLENLIANKQQREFLLEYIVKIATSMATSQYNTLFTSSLGNMVDVFIPFVRFYKSILATAPLERAERDSILQEFAKQLQTELYALELDKLQKDNDYSKDFIMALDGLKQTLEKYSPIKTNWGEPKGFSKQAEPTDSRLSENIIAFKNFTLCSSEENTSPAVSDQNKIHRP